MGETAWQCCTKHCNVTVSLQQTGDNVYMQRKMNSERGVKLQKGEQLESNKNEERGCERVREEDRKFWRKKKEYGKKGRKKER